MERQAWMVVMDTPGHTRTRVYVNCSHDEALAFRQGALSAMAAAGWAVDDWRAYEPGKPAAEAIGWCVEKMPPRS